MLELGIDVSISVVNTLELGILELGIDVSISVVNTLELGILELGIDVSISVVKTLELGILELGMLELGNSVLESISLLIISEVSLLNGCVVESELISGK